MLNVSRIILHKESTNMSCEAQTTKPIKINNVSFTLCSLRHTFDFNLTFELPKLPVYLSVANRHQGLVQNDKAVNWLLGDRAIGLRLGLMHLIVFSSEENHPKPKLHLWSMTIGHCHGLRSPRKGATSMSAILRRNPERALRGNGSCRERR